MKFYKTFLKQFINENYKYYYTFKSFSAIFGESFANMLKKIIVVIYVDYCCYIC